ncbi:uncharacterized protein LOC133883443 [Phragmites australis]|uniref:uncharacterized protein LOC133883443 n=1 Tax=Phragmites australis TaxID=29695 RepID=UPI002D786174|nr:uncharacterized protein LOC133883443 [Phragmites australis]
MAPTFGRSISFPLSPALSSRHHVRSVSLPSSRSHPLLAHLQNNIRAVRAWVAEPTAPASSGLAHLHALHAALAELLLLPEARAALHSGAATADCLLDGFLVLADAHGAFQETVLEVKRHAAEVQAALRRRDLSRLSSAVRAQRHAEKELAHLASSVRAAAKFPQVVGPAASAAEVEVSGVLAEAVAAVASASAAVFSALESISSAATTAAASSSKKSTTLVSLVKRTKAASSDEKEMAALDRLEDLEECIAEMEAGSDKVFRSILHTRVALLNIHTQTC